MDTLEPGLPLAVMVTTVENQNLSGYNRIRVLKAHQGLVSHFQAQVIEDMASISQLMSWTSRLGHTYTTSGHPPP